jgi:hypothetical protein
MFGRAGAVTLALALAGCTHLLVLDDVHDGGSAGSDAGDFKDAAGFAPDGYCGQGPGYVRLSYWPRLAQMVILLDRSAAMQANFDGTTRQAAVQRALVGTIAKYQARIKFGLEQFPGGPSAQCQPGTCCAGPVNPEPNLNNLSSMTNSIECSYLHGSSCPATGSDSPSYAALAAVLDDFKARDQWPPTDDDRYVLLVTSSDPSCAAESHNVCADARSAAGELGTLDNAGVRIVVLYLGDQPSPCLHKISQTPSLLRQPPNTQPLYAPNTIGELTGNLDEFLSAVARTSCTMDSATLPPSHDLAVSIGTDPIQPVDGSGQNGWSYANPNLTSITFSGSACDAWLKSQESKPTVAYCTACGAPIACPTPRP